MNIDLGNTRVGKLFIVYVIPSIIAVVATNTAILVDMIFIGRYIGPSSIAALTLINPIFAIIFAIAPMVGIGGATLAGIHKGNNEHKKSNNYFNMTFFLIIIISIAISIICFAFYKVIPNLLGLSDDVSNYASEYLLFFSPFTIGFLLPMTLSPFIKLDGKPVKIVIITIIGTITNIVLDYLFIVEFNMGMKGAALGTGLAQLTSSVLLFILILRSKNWFIRKPKFIINDLKAMLFNGSSEMFSLIAVAITGFIYNIIILKYIGEIGVAAYGIALQIFYLATTLFFGISDGIQSTISFNFGAKKLKRVKSMLKIAVATSTIIGLITAVASWFYGKELASLFVTHNNTIKLTAEILKFYTFAFIVLGSNIVITTYYTAINQPVTSIILALSRSVVIVLISLAILPLIFGEIGIWLPLITTEFVTFLIAIFYLKTKPFGKNPAT